MQVMNATRRSILAAGVGLLALGPSRCPAAEANLVPNGGFEAGAMDANRPAGWTPHVHGKTSVAWPIKGGRGGSRCLQMAADPNEKWGHAYWTSEAIPVRPCMAYRVRFHFKSAGFGVPCFSLSKVKSWRLFKGDTEGNWLSHEDVVVVPPDVTRTSFSVNNYNRPGKTMWLDDVSLIELPLSASPLSKRLHKARRSLAAIDRNVAGLHLTGRQQADLRGAREALAEVGRGYARLEKGGAAAADFRRINDGLDAVEKAVGAYLFTVWPVADSRAGPTAVSRTGEITMAPGPDGWARCRIGIMGLVDEGLPVRVTLDGGRETRDWPRRLLAAPAHRPTAWGELNSLGALYLPPGVPRLLTVEIRPAKAKGGTYAFLLGIQGLDRTTEDGQVRIGLAVATGKR